MININKLNFKLLIPIFYLSAWIVLLIIAQFWLGSNVVGSPAFLIASLSIIFIGIIGKSTSWAIGSDKVGIKGDSTSKRVEFCADGISTIKIFDDDPSSTERLMTKAGEIVKVLKDER